MIPPGIGIVHQVNLEYLAKEGVTPTDLVLRVTEMLRKQKVVAKFVEFFGEGAAALSLTDRATIANVAPEYGATMGFFGVDEETLAYLRGTGRSDELCEAFENYYKAQGLWGIPRKGDVDYTVELELARRLRLHDMYRQFRSASGMPSLRKAPRIDLDKKGGQTLQGKAPLSPRSSF